ncbi:hypothetical protein ACEPPN_007659 [Leptodophora sp. 'Broadleaf-Isolate-01']
MNVCVYDENFFNLVSGVANLGWQVMAMALSVYHGGGAFVFKKEKYGFAWTAKVSLEPFYVKLYVEATESGEGGSGSGSGSGSGTSPGTNKPDTGGGYKEMAVTILTSPQKKNCHAELKAEIKMRIPCGFSSILRLSFML